MLRTSVFAIILLCAAAVLAQTPPAPTNSRMTFTIVYRTSSFRQSIFEGALQSFLNQVPACSIRMTSSTAIANPGGQPETESSFEFIGGGAQEYSDALHNVIRNGRTQSLIDTLRGQSGIIISQISDTPIPTRGPGAGPTGTVTTKKSVPVFIIALCAGLGVLVLILIACLVLRKQHNDRMKLQDKMEVMMDVGEQQAAHMQSGGPCADASLSPPPPFKATPNQIARLERFYNKYAREKLKATTAESILRTFGGDEEELYRQLTTKYGPEPTA
jgi:hypothetical protein